MASSAVREGAEVEIRPTKNLATRLDHALGDMLERAVSSHHRRRLAKVGWARVIGPGRGLWADGDPPPRPGSSLEVFIDGAEAFPALVASARSARSHVHLAGWHLTPGFLLDADEPSLVVRNVIAEIAAKVKVRVLLWGGVPLPHPFRPSRREVRAAGEEIVQRGDVEFALDTHHRPLHCQHEKIMVVDDEVAFVGGLDLTDLSGDRLDGNEHRPRGTIGWHDETSRLRGPVVYDVAEHFRMRWREVTGKSLPDAEPPPPAGDVEVQIVRTVPERIYGSLPRGDFRICEVYLKALSSAQELIYLENQFLWSPEVVRVLAEKLGNPPSDDFRLVVLLPSKPSTGGDDTRGQLAVLAEADGGDRFIACTLYAHDDRRSDPVYVHAKIAIVDDRWLTLGSANLNNHSMFNDTEMNVVTCDPRLVRETRLRLWAEHLECPVEELAGSPAAIIDKLWRPTATEQLERRRAGRNPTHRLVKLPHVSKRADRLLGPLQSLVVDG